MSRFQQHIKPICFILLLIFSGSLKAAHESSSKKIYTPTPGILHRSEEPNEEKRREDILKHTQSLFTLVHAEIAYINQDIPTALSAYVYELCQSHSPEVAERAMEIAIDERAPKLAETIYQIWHEIDPTPSIIHQRLQWYRDSSNGNVAATFDNLDSVLRDANDKQRRHIFATLLYLSPSIQEQGEKSVHRAAQQYSYLAEANVADALYSSNRQSRALAALKQLAQNDPELSSRSVLGLQAIMHKSPDLLSRFFAKTQTRQLSQAWRELNIEQLISQNRHEEAEREIAQLIQDAPNARTYFQAAHLAMAQQPNNARAIIQYYKHAYIVGTPEEKSIAAFNIALRFAQAKQFVEAENWAEHIGSKKYVQDRIILQASLAAEQNHWKKARELAQNAMKQPEQQPTFFKQSDLLRVYLLSVSEGLPPPDALIELNRQVTQLERNKKGETYADDLSMILFVRGFLYHEKLQQPEKAIADFRRYLTMNPTSAEAHNMLGYTLLSIAGKESEALSLLQTAFRLSPENAQINDSLGWAYFKMGQLNQALHYVSFAYEHDQDTEIASHLGEIYWRLNQPDKAREIWQRAWKTRQKRELLERTLKTFGVSFSD